MNYSKKTQNFTKWIEQRLKDQATKTIKSRDFHVSIFGSCLVILSGALLFADKFSTFGISNTYGFEDPQTFVWVFSQSFSPIILCLGATLKPYKFFYAVPLYLYFIQVYWIFNPDLKIDDTLLHIYALGFCIFVFIFVAFLLFLLRFTRKKSNKLLFNIRKMSSFIIFDVREKYVDKSKRKAFAKDIVKLNKTLK